METSLLPTKDAESSGNLPATPAPSNPMSLLAMAVERGTDPAQLEKLMDLQERWERNQAAQEFASAFARFQARCPQIQKTKKSHNGTFAPYDEIMRVIQPLLAEEELSVSFDMDHSREGIIGCTVILKRGIHEHRTRHACRVPQNVKVNESQQDGQAISYAKRYAIKSALNLVETDEDRDADYELETITKEQQTTIYNLLAETDSDIAAFLKWAGVEELSLMPANKYGMAVAALNKKKAKVKS